MRDRAVARTIFNDLTFNEFVNQDIFGRDGEFEYIACDERDNPLMGCVARAFADLSEGPQSEITIIVRDMDLVDDAVIMASKCADRLGSVDIHSASDRWLSMTICGRECKLSVCLPEDWYGLGESDHMIVALPIDEITMSVVTKFVTCVGEHGRLAIVGITPAPVWHNSVLDDLVP